MHSLPDKPLNTPYYLFGLISLVLHAILFGWLITPPVFDVTEQKTISPITVQLTPQQASPQKTVAAIPETKIIEPKTEPKVSAIKQRLPSTRITQRSEPVAITEIASSSSEPVITSSQVLSKNTEPEPSNTEQSDQSTITASSTTPTVSNTAAQTNAHEADQNSDLSCPENPKPTYPAIARRLGQTGIVTLRILVGIDGTPKTVQILKSSNHSRLDEAAKSTVENNWHCTPQKQNSVAIEHWGVVDIPFQLTK